MREVALHPARIDALRQRGELVDDRLRARPGDGAGDGVARRARRRATASAPAPRSASSLSGERVIAVTSWPCREQQRQQPAPDHAAGAGEEDPHAATRPAAPAGPAAARAARRPCPSLKPAEPMAKAELKRERRFSIAIMFDQLDELAPRRSAAQRARKLVGDLHRRPRHRRGEVQREHARSS